PARPRATHRRAHPAGEGGGMKGHAAQICRRVSTERSTNSHAGTGPRPHPATRQGPILWVAGWGCGPVPHLSKTYSAGDGGDRLDELLDVPPVQPGDVDPARARHVDRMLGPQPADLLLTQRQDGEQA